MTSYSAHERFEWGALILQGPLGDVFLSPARSQRDPDNVTLDTGELVPPGATILGWIHTHPWSRGDPLPNYTPSDDDVRVANQLTAAAGGGRVLTYIVDLRGADKTYELTREALIARRRPQEVRC